jgi:hypothetical protein
MSTITTIEADGVSVLSAMPSIAALIGDFSTLAAGISTGTNDGGVKVAATATSLSKLIGDLLTAYSTFHATQAALTASPTTN